MHATAQSDTDASPSREFFATLSVTSEQAGHISDTFLTGMQLVVITGDRFCADFANLKQAYSLTRTSNAPLTLTMWNSFIY